MFNLSAWHLDRTLRKLNIGFEFKRCCSMHVASNYRPWLLMLHSWLISIIDVHFAHFSVPLSKGFTCIGNVNILLSFNDMNLSMSFCFLFLNMIAPVNYVAFLSNSITSACSFDRCPC